MWRKTQVGRSLLIWPAPRAIFACLARSTSSCRTRHPPSEVVHITKGPFAHSVANHALAAAVPAPLCRDQGSCSLRHRILSRGQIRANFVPEATAVPVSRRLRLASEWCGASRHLVTCSDRTNAPVDGRCSPVHGIIVCAKPERDSAQQPIDGLCPASTLTSTLCRDTRMERFPSEVPQCWGSSWEAARRCPTSV